MAKVKETKSAKNFIKALNALEEERGISKQTVLDALSEALEKSYKKNYLGPDSIVKVHIDDVTGKIELFEIKHVVDDVMDEDYELSEEEAQEIDPKYHVGDDVVTEVSPDVFGRLAAIQTKQILRQKIREAEKEALYNEYVDKKDDIITGIVDRVEERFAIINIGKTGALLPVKAQIPGEKLTEGQHLKVYVSAVDKNTKGTHIAVSRTEPGLVKRLFEAEVPEIYDGTVEIKSVAREAGERSKIAVYTANPDIDPIGSCVGPKGTRVQNVVNELNGEMIDIVEWNEDPVVFISNALSPAKVSHVKLNKEDNSALVVVPDDQLSLAIGKKGQNARLAVHLTNWKIDIKSQSEVAEEGIDLSDNDDQDDLLAMMAGEGNDESFDSDESFDTDESFDDNESFDDEDDGVKIDIEALREANEEKDTDYVKVISEDDDEESEEKPDYDPKYDEDIDYDEYDKYYD
ncbi:transcription termination factor NusA [Intestinibaculum porci]|jgi:N utilization substance protein A|uniref:transcription termination factor NusA n=1 Tax=Intestinibaculum porci TaxID=2487118 RepID=UPI00240A3710|nr:transcription termination factor NusA [Intestinibaculum porci]MDD6348586.1 transcription termination factor NusA [Intestinibaculum porci]MDD6423302.1 transcription termination factor NusA [Intestinibaculum porci]